MMKRISVELVPRSEDALRADLRILKGISNYIDLINVPDLLRLTVRSWQGAAVAQEFYPVAMPHIRAIDIDLSKPLPMAADLRKHNIKEVLVVKGDPPQDMSHRIYPTVSTDVIRKFREELPEVKVYAGIDQYRGSMNKERYKIRRKLQAGASGFFTQPFFDMRFLEMYQEMLSGLEVYWGVSPITSERSKNYWELKNNVVFPKSFEPTMEWSIGFAKRVLEFAGKNDANVYLMPIKSDIETYLSGVLGAVQK